jgi:hypothetical protein
MGGPLHLAVRVPLMTRVGIQSISTVLSHNEIIDRFGRFALAKFGQPGTSARAQALQRQIEQGQTTLLVLIIKRSNRFIGYQCRLVSVHRGPPTSEIKSIAPTYYRELGIEAALWLIADSPLVTCDLKKFCLSTSQRPLIEVIRECRTASMLIQMEQSL